MHRPSWTCTPRPANNSSTFTDPCVGLTTARITANPNLALACVGVPTDGSFAQPNGQVTGLLLSNADLDPETGDVMTFGLTWQPSFLNNNFSIRVDYWQYQIDDVITQLDTNFSINQCVATGDPAFCNLVTRFTDVNNAGIVYLFRAADRESRYVGNGWLSTSVRPIICETRPPVTWPSRSTGPTSTSYDNLPAENAAIVHVAGTYDRQYGNYAENRATATIGWNMNKFDAQIGARFIDDIVLLLPSGGTLAPEDNPPLPIDSFVYLDLYFGYTFNDNIKVSLSATNLSDEQPPMLYQNNVTNANTDVNTYDTLGRRYAISATYKF